MTTGRRDYSFQFTSVECNLRVYRNCLFCTITTAKSLVLTDFQKFDSSPTNPVIELLDDGIAVEPFN